MYDNINVSERRNRKDFFFGFFPFNNFNAEVTRFCGVTRDGNDRMPFCQQPACQVRTNQTSCARDENIHNNLSKSDDEAGQDTGEISMES